MLAKRNKYHKVSQKRSNLEEMANTHKVKRLVPTPVLPTNWLEYSDFPPFSVP